MERAGKSLGKLKLSDKISAEELAKAAWQAAVGKRIALHSSAIALVRDKLVVEVEDVIWRQQLFHLRHQILKRLCEVIGDELITDLEFRVAVVRRPPQAATKLVESDDEADRIEDSMLRLVYRQARKRASQ